MLSPFFEMQVRDFRKILRDVGTYLVFGGKRIDCSFASSDDDYQLAADGGGTIQIYTLIATCVKSDFTNGILPKKGEVITADGVEYQVSRSNARPGSPLVKIYFSNQDA